MFCTPSTPLVCQHRRQRTFATEPICHAQQRGFRCGGGSYVQAFRAWCCCQCVDSRKVLFVLDENSVRRHGSRNPLNNGKPMSDQFASICHTPRAITPRVVFLPFSNVV